MIVITTSRPVTCHAAPERDRVTGGRMAKFETETAI